MTKNFEGVLRRMLATPPTPQKEKHKKSEMVDDLKEEEFKSGDRVPHSGIYLVTHKNTASRTKSPAPLAQTFLNVTSVAQLDLRLFERLSL